MQQNEITGSCWGLVWTIGKATELIAVSLPGRGSVGPVASGPIRLSIVAIASSLMLERLSLRRDQRRAEHVGRIRVWGRGLGAARRATARGPGGRRIRVGSTEGAGCGHEERFERRPGALESLVVA